MINVLMAAAAVGGLALVMAKLGENQSKMQRKALEDQDLNTFVNTVNKHLLNDKACKSTFSSVKGLIQDNQVKPIYSIKNFNGVVVYNTGDKQISPKLNILSMDVKRIDSKSIELEISIEKTNKRAGIGAKHFLKRFKMDALLENGEVTKCFSQLDGAVSTSNSYTDDQLESLNEQFCKTVGGAKASGTDRCVTKVMIGGPIIINEYTGSSSHTSGASQGWTAGKCAEDHFAKSLQMTSGDNWSMKCSGLKFKGKVSDDNISYKISLTWGDEYTSSEFSSVNEKYLCREGYFISGLKISTTKARVYCKKALVKYYLREKSSSDWEQKFSSQSTRVETKQNIRGRWSGGGNGWSHKYCSGRQLMYGVQLVKSGDTYAVFCAEPFVEH